MSVDLGVVRKMTLEQRQALDLDTKIEIAKAQIKQFYERMDGKVYVAFSGGKDSTALIHLVRSVYPDVVGVFSNTGVEYPELKQFVKKFDNIDVIKPKMPYPKILKEYGFPIISKEVAGQIETIRNISSSKTKNAKIFGKGNYGGLPKKYRFLYFAPFKITNKCCQILKKDPFHDYHKETGRCPFVGVMASEGIKRKESWHKHRCNAFDMDIPQSRPMMTWLEQDVWAYIKKFNLEYCSVYDTNGITRTGCVFCAFGIMHDNPNRNRFQALKETHPGLYKACMNMGWGDVLDFIGIPKE